MSTAAPFAAASGGSHPIALLQAENRILELATRNTPLPKVLETLALSAEDLVGGAVLCSILLLDSDGRHLLHGAAPTLPKPYNDAIHGIEIGPTVGSCGTAASTGFEVVVSDIATHPYWAPFKDLAMGHGLRACWSTPIFSSRGAVLGTFAMYYREPSVPTPEAREIVDLLARTTALVLERARLHEDLTRKIAQHEEAEDLLRTAQDAARLATWSWQIGDDSMLFAPGSAEILPMPLANIATYRRFLQLVRDDDQDRVARAFERAIEERGKFEVEFGVDIAGKTRWILAKGRAVDPDTTASFSAVGVYIDITQRRQAELDLLESRESFRRAQEAANIGSWTWDMASGKITQAAGVPIFHGLQGDIDQWMSRVHPEDRPGVERALQSAMRGGEFSYECRLQIDPAQAPRWVFTSGRVETLNGEPISAAGITMDVTERRESEIAQRLTEDRFRLVLEASDIGFWYCDLPFDQLVWDDKVKEHFWMTPDHTVNIDDFYARIHPDDREQTREAIARSNDLHQPYDTDYRTVDPRTGAIKWVRAAGRTTYDAAGKPIRFDGITIDFTERKRAEEALRSSEKLAATGRLAATIAHEINNPLEAVTNFIYLAKNNRELPPKVKGYLDVADRELARVSHIAQQTLGFYRDSSQPARFDAANVIDDVLLLYERKLAYKGLLVERRYSHGLSIVGLAGELRQVLSNLLANAIDACPDDVSIHVRARFGNNVLTGIKELRITIADQGCGMSPEVRQSLFTPFFTTKQDVGTGLGLWVTRGIIDKHKGSLRFRSSNGSTSGTVFRIVLPADQPSPARSDA